SGGKKNRLLPVYFLQFQIRGQKISICDLALLQQFLHGWLCKSAISAGTLVETIQFDCQPFGLWNPSHPCVERLPSDNAAQCNLVLAVLQAAKNLPLIDLQEVLKNVQRV